MYFSDSETRRIAVARERAASCSNFYISSTLVTPDIVTVRTHPVLCHSPFCKKCNDIKVQKLWPKIEDFSKRRQLRFITVTYSADVGPAEVLRRFSSDWNKFVTYLRRRKYKFNFFKIIEFTKRNILHFHVLIDCYIPQGLISNVWRDVTGTSYIVFITKVLSREDALRYTIKYITKSKQGHQAIYVAKNVRRFSFSRFTWDFQRSIDLTPDPYEFYFHVYNSLEELKADYIARQRNERRLHPERKPYKLVFL